MSEPIWISDSGNENLISDIQNGGSEFAYDESIAMTDWKIDSNVIPDPLEPLWEVYLDGTRTTGKLLHKTGIDDSSRYINSGKLSLVLGEPGSFSFSITPAHYLYEDLIPYKSTITVYHEGVELFRGRVIGYSTDILRQRSVNVDGDLTYLADVVFQGGELDLKNRKLSDAFSYFISAYDRFGKLSNGDARYLEAGEVTISKANYNVHIGEWLDKDDSTLQFMDVRSLIDEFLETFGGYLRTRRRQDGVVVVDYLAGYTDVNEQTIYYGGNLIELSIDSKPDELFTVLIPIGDDDDDNKNIRIENVNYKDASVSGATISHTKGSGTAAMELVWDEGVALYGRIMKQEDFSGIKNRKELRSRAISYFRECIASHLGNYTLKAVDMHYLDSAYRPIYLGQKVRIISAPHNVDTINQMLTCMKIEYDLENPESTSYEFDIPFQPLTGSFTSNYKKKQEKQDKQTKKAGGGAGKAKKKAEEAKGAAEEAKGTADEAKETADGAKNKVKSVEDIAKGADDKADEAKNAANEAKNKADEAKNKADGFESRITALENKLKDKK